MTCIVGIADKDGVYIGGDSAGVAGLNILIRQDPKVFINGPFIIGCTTSFRMIQLLQYRFDPPKQTVNVDDMKYMCTEFVDAIRKLFATYGFGKMADKSDNSGGQFLVGYRGNLYAIHDDFQVELSSVGYNAVGCGFSLAMGSLFSTTDKKPEQRIKIALKAASTFNAGVSPPFKVLKQMKE